MMFSVALAALLSLLFCGGVQGWVVTNYYVLSLSTYTYQARTYVDSTYEASTTTYSDLITVTPTVSDFTPLSTTTSTGNYDDVTYVEILLPTGVAEEKTRIYDSEDSYYTTYYVDLFYTANTRSCTRDDQYWVWSTQQYISVPSGIAPSVTETRYRETVGQAFGPTTTYTQYMLDPTEIPSSSISSISSNYMPYWASYSCAIPATASAGAVQGAMAIAGTATGSAATARATDWDEGGRASDGTYKQCSSYDDNWGWSWGFGSEYECNTNPSCWCHDGLQPWEFAVVIICGWLGLFFFAGLIESWFNFRKLARGRSARRGLPICWAFVMPFISLFFLCCSKRGFSKKSPEEQEALTAQWKQFGVGKAIGLWLKWGFRYKYPSFLGPAPFRRANWDDKVIAEQAARRASVSGDPAHTESLIGGGVPPAGGYYAPTQAPTPGAPAQPEMAYVAPGSERRDFGDSRSMSLNPAPQTGVDGAVSPASPIERSEAGPAPRSLKGKEPAVVAPGAADIGEAR